MKRKAEVTLVLVGFSMALVASACAVESMPLAENGAPSLGSAQSGIGNAPDGGCAQPECQGECPKQNGAEAPTEIDAARADPIPLGDSPRKGADDADVVIVLSSEFECPYCARVNLALERVMAEYGDRVAIVYKHSPLPFHRNAVGAAMAAEAARRQGNFWDMYDLLFASQSQLNRESYLAWAKQLGLDMEAFEADLDSSESAERVKRDQELIEDLGGRGVPNLWINGHHLVGAQPFEKLQAVIDAELDG